MLKSNIIENKSHVKDFFPVFKEKLHSYNLNLPDTIEIDKFVHFSTNGDKNKNGWYKLFINPGGSAGGVFGDWQTGLKETFFYSSNGKNMSETEKTRFNADIEKAVEESRAIRIEAQKQAAKKAQNIWNTAESASHEHPYIKIKQVESYGLKQKGEALIVPVHNESGDIISLQRIYTDGSKRFLSGGKTKGGSFTIDGKKDVIYLVEGYATGATIHEATEQTVCIAFNSGNLEAMAIILRKKYPDNLIVIAADNDLSTEQKTGKNPGKISAEAAAAAIGANICLCPVNSDFNDLMVSQGIDAVKVALQKIEHVSEPNGEAGTGNLNTPDPWEPVIPLDAQDVDKLDPDTLPGIIGEYAEAVALETETPLELAAGMLFVAIAACVQGRVKIQVKPGYSEPMAFWTFTPMPPATRKSQVLKQVTQPLIDWERRQWADMAPLIEARRIDRENTQARIKALRGKYGKAKRDDMPGISDEIQELSDSMEPELVAPQIWAQDCTPENAGQIMARNNEKLTILAAEGGILDTLGGRYSNVANLDLFLQGYSGDAVKVNRTTRDDIHMNTPTLSMGLMPQPDVMRGMAAKPEFKGRGFIGRPMYMAPESNLGRRTLDSEPIPERLKSQYYQTIDHLLEIQPIENPNGTTEPHTLTLSPEAFKEWKDFFMTIEHDLADGGRFEYCRDWAGKTPGRAARLAGLFHCTMNPVEPWRYPVSLETMEQALDITVVSISHALAVFNLMGMDPAIEGAGRILNWITRHRHQTFTKKQAFDALRGTFTRAAMLDEPLAVLVERNHIRPMVEAEKKPGRKSEAYKVNPAVFEGGEHGLA